MSDLAKIIGYRIRNYRTQLGLGQRESNPACLTRARFPFDLASKLEIRQYICVFRLRRNENFARYKFKEVCAAAFFQSAKHEFAERLAPFKNECKIDE